MKGQRTAAQAAVREFLSDGGTYTIPQIADAIGQDYQRTLRAIRKMPDVYRDHWKATVQGLKTFRWVACYALADVPPDAPMPSRRARASDVVATTTQHPNNRV